MPTQADAEMSDNEQIKQVTIENAPMSRRERAKMARALEKHHAVFERIWRISRILMTDHPKLPTAGVLFNKEGKCVDFVVNKKFWESLNHTNREFVLCHECMHISLNHGHRTQEMNKSFAKIVNWAQDVVINHGLVNLYGFNQDEIDPVRVVMVPKMEFKQDEEGNGVFRPVLDEDGEVIREEKLDDEGKPIESRGYCWVETCFPDSSEEIPDDENFEYYFNRLKEDMDGNGGNGDDDERGDNFDTVDAHGITPEDLGLNPDDYTEDFGEVIEHLNEELTSDEKQTLKDFIEKNENSDPKPEKSEENQEGGRNDKGDPNDTSSNSAGTEAGGRWDFAKKQPITKPVKFEAIVTGWAKKYMKDTARDVDQFVIRNRRFRNMHLPTTILPTEGEVWGRFPEQDRTEVWFFQDTSGSCSGYRDRFFNIAERMPPDKFTMRLFCFDTEIYPTSLESRELFGFGGTYFHIIEEYIRDQLKYEHIKKYPEAVFVITDGFGTDVSPAKPKNWHVILTPRHAKNNFPDECNFYDLSNYE